MTRPPRMDLLGLGRLLRALAAGPVTQAQACEILGISTFEPRGHRYLGYLRDMGFNARSRQGVCHLMAGKTTDALAAADRRRIMALEGQLSGIIALAGGEE